MGETRNTQNISMSNALGKYRLGRPIKRWEGNIEMDLREISCGDGR
jgi:hypothetical protein